VGELFKIGNLYATPGILEKIPQSEIIKALNKHSQGDWGDICEEDRKTNNEAVETGCRIMSAYHSANGITFWIITEADRNATTILLPSEY